MRLALFDLDHTLLDGDSNRLWLERLIAEGLAPEALRERQAAFYASYERGGLDVGEYLAFCVGLLVGRPASTWRAVRDAWVEEVVVPRLAPAGLAALHDHRADGDRVAVVTATHGWLVEGIVAPIGRVDRVATPPELDGDRFTGRLAGPPCFAADKLPRVREWLARDGLALEAFDAVRFYSDSFNDLPLLQAVSEPVAVNPDPRLAAVASARGWPVRRWRAQAAGDAPAH
jgi:HAD superfamily hydrolase (TIGR01490 family)